MLRTQLHALVEERHFALVDGRESGDLANQLSSRPILDGGPMQRISHFQSWPRRFVRAAALQGLRPLDVGRNLTDALAIHSSSSQLYREFGN